MTRILQGLFLACVSLGTVLFTPVTRSESDMQAKDMEPVLQGHRDEIMALPGVVGIAQGECSGHPCIKVYVSEIRDELRSQMPAEIEGFPVVIEITGPLKLKKN